MRKNLIIPPDKFRSSFLSCEKDAELICRKLFLESLPYSNELKRLLIINAKDCLDNTENEQYQEKINLSLKEIKDKGYIRFMPRIQIQEFEELKSYIIVSFDNFTPNNTNPQFRDHIVNFDILCHFDYWDLGNFRMRPLKIAGYIDGILNNTKLTGIGTFQFLTCKELILSENWGGYTLSYMAIQGSDDKIPEDAFE